MSKLIKPGTAELNTKSTSADKTSAVSQSSAVDSIDLKQITQAPVSQREYLQLMLVQLRRVEDLEQENRKLLAERDVLNEKYLEQLKIVTALKTEKVRNHRGPQTSKKNQGRSLSKTTAIHELPEIDAAEFQPVQEESESGLAQSYKVVADTTAALGNAVGNSVKSSASWCGKKVVAILT